MLSRFKRILRRILSRGNPSSALNQVTYEDGRIHETPYFTDDDTIIITKENIVESLPLINEMAGLEENLIPRRKVTSLAWNGPILDLEGYFYIENIPMKDEDLVKKRLILLGSNGIKISIPLQEVSIYSIQENKDINQMYEWAGFKGNINFATLFKNNQPLPEGEYKVYLELEVHVLGDKVYKKNFQLGNVEKFLKKRFHSTKMEYFTAKREMKFNLLATYDLSRKTLKITSTKLKDMDPTEMGLDSEQYNRGLFYRFFSTTIFRLAYKIYCFLPIKQKKIFFASDSRTEMSGNFLFVYEEMLRRELDFDYHFLLKKGVAEKKSYREIIHLAYHIATSKFIVLDDFYPMIYHLKIREGAELVQLWHAVGAFKTFGFSRLGRPGGPSPKSKSHRNYTKAIVSSEHVSKHYAEGFGIEKDKVVSTGIPRTDVFFDKEYQYSVRERLYAEYPFLRGKKVIMFAPTFRGNGQQSAHYPMEILDLENLYKELSDEYVFLFKIHPFVKNDFSIPYQYSDFYYDFSSYREINDLLFITDLLITDYSSVCFEFALLNKPMLFFAYDVEEYVQKRDFYYDFHSFIPGPLVRSSEEIVNTIKEEDFEMEKIKPFVHYFFDDVDGKASARVVNQIFMQQGEENN